MILIFKFRQKSMPTCSVFKHVFTFLTSITSKPDKAAFSLSGEDRSHSDCVSHLFVQRLLAGDCYGHPRFWNTGFKNGGGKAGIAELKYTCFLNAVSVDCSFLPFFVSSLLPLHFFSCHRVYHGSFSDINGYSDFQR